MGKSTKSWVANPFVTQFTELGKNIDPLGRGSQRRAEKAAERAAAEQQKAIAKQRQRETLKLMEEESNVAERQAFLTSPKNRSLLIATSPRGVPNLGGTNV